MFEEQDEGIDTETDSEPAHETNYEREKMVLIFFS